MFSKVLMGGAIALTSSVAAGQVTFTIDHRGPTNGFPDAYGSPANITEGDILAPAKGQVLLGPLFQPGIGYTAGPGGRKPTCAEDRLTAWFCVGNRPGSCALVFGR